MAKDKDIYKFTVRLYGDRDRDAKSIEFLSNQHSISINRVISIAIAEYVKNHGVDDITNQLIVNNDNSNRQLTVETPKKAEKKISKKKKATPKPKVEKNTSKDSSNFSKPILDNQSSTENKPTSDDEFFNVWDNDDLLND